jgi:hypothetical protein
LKRILPALAATATLAVVIAPAGASTGFLSLKQARAAALRSARAYESYINDTSNGSQFLYHPLAFCKNGRLSPTLVLCGESWVYYSPKFNGDTVVLTQFVHVSLAGGRISVTASGKPCLWDNTTGWRSGNCT